MATTWTLYGISAIINDSETYFFKCFALAIGSMMLFIYIYEKKPFIIIENDTIKKNQFPKSQFNLLELGKINYNINGYILHSENQEDFKITTSILKEEDCKKLKTILEVYETKITN